MQFVLIDYAPIEELNFNCSFCHSFQVQSLKEHQRVPAQITLETHATNPHLHPVKLKFQQQEQQEAMLTLMQVMSVTGIQYTYLYVYWIEYI